MRCPCKGCEERSIYCHSNCSAYIRFAEENAERREKRYLESLAQPERKPKRNALYSVWPQH